MLINVVQSVQAAREAAQYFEKNWRISHLTRQSNQVEPEQQCDRFPCPLPSMFSATILPTIFWLNDVIHTTSQLHSMI